MLMVANAAFRRTPQSSIDESVIAFNRTMNMHIFESRQTAEIPVLTQTHITTYHSAFDIYGLFLAT